MDSLITLYNIITGLRNIGLRDLNVYPAVYYSKMCMYMDQRYIENAFYGLVDKLNNRIISHKDFCKIFLNIHPFRDGNKLYLLNLFIQGRKNAQKQNRK